MMHVGSCPKDGFPTLKIHGRERCVAEYLDYCIGGQAIADVVRRDDTIYYVFENRHELPLLCFCCGNPLEFEDFEGHCHRMIGRRLEAMRFDEAEVEDGSERIRFILEFTPKGIIGRGTDIVVSLAVAERMMHPPMCRQAPRRQHHRK